MNNKPERLENTLAEVVVNVARRSLAHGPTCTSYEPQSRHIDDWPPRHLLNPENLRSPRYDGSRDKAGEETCVNRIVDQRWIEES